MRAGVVVLSLVQTCLHLLSFTLYIDIVVVIIVAIWALSQT